MTKFLFDERFPTKIVANSPLSVVKSGTTYTFSIDSSGFSNAQLDVWKLRAALQATSSSAFHTYEASLGSDLSDTRRNRWEGGGKTVTGDGLYTDIKTTLGWTTLQMTNLYTLAGTITG